MSKITPSLAIHGGVIFGPEDYDAAIREEYVGALSRALTLGYRAMRETGSAGAAVETAIRVMEDCGLFDAGRGAVFTSAGTNELDASFMDGKTGLAGAVAGVNRIKNPISAAVAVMKNTWHVMLIGPGAEEFARAQGLEMVDPSYFFNEQRWKHYQELKAKEEAAKPKKTNSHSTVGAVAVDAEGNVAAGTSTGGITMKHWSRVGDSPIIGAGTYADNRTCAVSCTGSGEYFIRGAVAYDVHARMLYKGLTLRQAITEALAEKVTQKGAKGGIIGITSGGQIAMEYNCAGMFRGKIGADGKIYIAIQEDWGFPELVPCDMKSAG